MLFKKISLRFFAQKRVERSVVYVNIQCANYRKCFSIPVFISQSQRQFLTPRLGIVKPHLTEEDMRVNSELAYFQKLIIDTIAPLTENGEYFKMNGYQLTQCILKAHNEGKEE